MVDIFAEGKELKGNKFDFIEVGDKLQGTYVSKDQVTTRYGLAWIYEIKDEAGDYWIVWGKPSIDRVMKHVKLGQILGFHLVAIIPKQGRNDFKDVKVIADPNIVDEEWIKENDMINAEEVKAPEGGSGTIEEAMKEMTKDSGPEAPSSDADQLAKIGELAKSKLGVDNPDEIQEKVMEATNTAWLPSNFKDIISKLEAM